MVKDSPNSKEKPDSPEMIELIKYLREKDEKIEKLIEEKTELKIRFDLTKQKLQKENTLNKE